MFSSVHADFLIIGSGVIGLSIGISILKSNPDKKVLIVEKESASGLHASGRNSGVLHAGFYYSPDSIKAQFCADGNRELKAFCKANDLPLKEIGKVVVTSNQGELERLNNLYERGIRNKIELELLNESELRKIEPAARTHGQFIWSPTTAVGDPKAVITQLCEIFKKMGGKFFYGKEISLITSGTEIIPIADKSMFPNSFVINTAGAYADQLAKSVGVGSEFICLPFIGIYRSNKSYAQSPKKLIYPLPHPINPFLGAHVTVKLNGDIKIGPTAFPVIGREQYSLKSAVSLFELRNFAYASTALIKGKEYNLFEIVRSEFPKFRTKMLINGIRGMVPNIANGQDWQKLPPGIRAQLVNRENGKLVQDFIIRHKANSVHILNAVSPGWTCALPFGRWIAESIVGHG